MNDLNTYNLNEFMDDISSYNLDEIMNDLNNYKLTDYETSLIHKTANLIEKFCK